MKKNKFILIITFIILTFVLNVNAGSSNLIDFNKKGDVSLTLKAGSETPLEGVEIKIYKIASPDIENNNLIYNYEKGFSSCSIDLNNLNDERIPSALESCLIEKETINLVKKTDSKGKVSFNNLDLGLYLLVQTNKMEGYSKFDSFLVMIPENIDNEWIYNIEATPKTEIYETMDLKVQKMWFNMYYEIPDKITVALMKNDEILKTAELGNHNNWTYIFKDIEKYDSYKVVELDVPDGFKVVYRDYLDVYMIINIDYLAQTGQNLILMVTLSCVGLIFIVVGIYLNKRKKYE